MSAGGSQGGTDNERSAMTAMPRTQAKVIRAPVTGAAEVTGVPVRSSLE